MSIYYCSMPTGNVGDDLNKFMWDELIDFNKLDSNDVIVGIGSILNDKMPSFENKRVYVIGSGIGYGKLPKFGGNWEFLAVRGKITRDAFNLKKDIPLLDSAYLANLSSYLSNEKKNNLIGYVPHVQSLENDDWLKICNAAGLELIDPRQGISDFINKLSRCDKVMCEAMHGAIFADICRIPWQPVKAYSHINTNKWKDWLSAFNMDINFSRIKGTWRHIELAKDKKVKNLIKRFALYLYDTDKIYKPIYPASSETEFNKLIDQLEELKKRDFFLNSEEKINKSKEKCFDEIVKYSWSKI